MFSKLFTKVAVTTTVVFCQANLARAEHGTVYTEHRHSTTLEEGLLYGQGFLERNRGAGFRDMAEGKKALAEAERLGLINRKTAVEYRFALQSANQAQQAAKRSAPPSPEDVARRAKESAPRQLTPNELSAEGLVQWPAALCDAQHAEARNSIEAGLKYLLDQTHRGQIASMRKSLLAHCEQLKSELRSQQSQTSAADFVASCKFIEGLRQEVMRSSESGQFGQVTRR
jgi:hypothetical protein